MLRLCLMDDEEQKVYGKIRSAVPELISEVSELCSNGLSNDVIKQLLLGKYAGKLGKLKEKGTQTDEDTLDGVVFFLTQFDDSGVWAE